MKLMLIVASDEYADEISEILLNNNYMATVIGSSGDFLQYGYTILLLGVEKAQCEKVIRILKNGSRYSKNEGFPYNGEVSIYQIDVKKSVKVNAGSFNSSEK